MLKLTKLKKKRNYLFFKNFKVFASDKFYGNIQEVQHSMAYYLYRPRDQSHVK